MHKMFDAYAALTVERVAPQLREDGYDAVALYYFNHSQYKKLLTRPVAEAVTRAGLYVVSLWESGNAVAAEYFTADRGRADGGGAAVRARAAGQPGGSVIYATVDYDAAAGDLARISDYFAAFRGEMRSAGYGAGVYGSGLVCRHLKEAGLVSKTWLAQSRGFAGFADWEPLADIVQGPVTTIRGMDADADAAAATGGGGWKGAL